ncbi:MAG: patatin-like phospholipase family protein [Terriglobales bacterium]
MKSVKKIIRSVQAFGRELSRLSVAPEMASGRPGIGIALGGGFARGIAHVGVLKVLEEEKIPIDFIAGTSVGALIGAAYCSGVTPAELEVIARRVRFKTFARWTLSRHGFATNQRMIGFLQSILKVKSFEELRIPLAVTATDLSTGEGVVFHSGPLVEPVRASCAYPGMFLPVNIRGRWLVDGMLAHAVPTRPLVEMGAKRVLAVHLKGRWSNGKEPRHLFDVIGQCFAIAQDMCSSQWKEAADLVIEPDVHGFEYDAFVHTTALIKAGETATRAALPALRKWIETRQPVGQARAARALVQAATMPAD